MKTVVITVRTARENIGEYLFKAKRLGEGEGLTQGHSVLVINQG
jgi:hypothetical protein